MIAEYIAHRIEREQQILAALRGGAADINDLLDEVYAGLDPSLRLAAAFQVHTQLIKLRDEGWVVLGEGGVQGATRVELVERP